jgi:hypothetical protein
MSMFVPCFIKEKQGSIIGVICEAVGIVFWIELFVEGTWPIVSLMKILRELINSICILQLDEFTWNILWSKAMVILTLYSVYANLPWIFVIIFSEWFQSNIFHNGSIIVQRSAYLPTDQTDRVMRSYLNGMMWTSELFQLRIKVLNSSS